MRGKGRQTTQTDVCVPAACAALPACGAEVLWGWCACAWLMPARSTSLSFLSPPPPPPSTVICQPQSSRCSMHACMQALQGMAVQMLQAGS